MGTGRTTPLIPEESRRDSRREVNWKAVRRDLLRVVLLPVFLVYVIVIALYTCIPLLCNWLFLRWHRDSYGTTEEWIPEQASYEGGEPSIKLKDVHYDSIYLPMADGVKLAMDIWLPPRKDRSSEVGCVLHQSRYGRSMKPWGLTNLMRHGLPFNPVADEFFQAFLARGLAVVSVDLRGTGASHGVLRGPWHRQDTADSLEVLEWITRQPWSNGKVGTWGISYEATAALLTSIAGHPSVKAVCPMYPFLDVYSEVAFLYGLRFSSFVTRWERITRSIDSNFMERVMPIMFFTFDGVMPVKKAAWSEFDCAVAEHKENWRPISEGRSVEYRDDCSEYSGLSAKNESPYVRIDKWLAALKNGSSAANKPPGVFLISGWFDVTAACALKLAYHLEPVTEVQLMMAPWNHGGVQHGRFHEGAKTSFRRFKVAKEVGDYFLNKLQTVEDIEGQQPSPQPLPPPVRYYTAQEEKWKTPPTFPLANKRSTRMLYLQSTDARYIPPKYERGWRRCMESSRAVRGGGVLRTDLPRQGSNSTLPVDVKRDVGNVGVSRYTAMTEAFLPMSYDLDHHRVSHLRFRSSPLVKPMEVTGFPVVRLYVSSSFNDASLFCYLLCVDQKGRSHYVTEGALRVSSRRESASLRDTSVLSYPGIPTYSFDRGDAEFLTPNGPPVLVTLALLPTSYMFLPGQCIGLAIGGADGEHFEPLNAPHGHYDLTVHTGPQYPSQLLLPMPPEPQPVKECDDEEAIEEVKAEDIAAVAAAAAISQATRL